MAISLPTGSGNTGTNDWSDVFNNDNQLVTEIDARDDNYQTIYGAAGLLRPDAAAGTWIVGSVSLNVTGGIFGSMVTSATSVDLSGTTPAILPVTYYWDDADVTIASKTTKLRLRAQVNTNATAWSSVTATIGLYPVTFAGAADNIAFTLGTVVPGSTVALVNPSASTNNQGNSGDFTIPSDGQHCLGVVTSAQLTNNAVSQVSAQVQMRWV